MEGKVAPAEVQDSWRVRLLPAGHAACLVHHHWLVVLGLLSRPCLCPLLAAEQGIKPSGASRRRQGHRSACPSTRLTHATAGPLHWWTGTV